MGDRERRAAIEIKANYLLEEYVKIVAEMFPSCATLEMFIQHFSSTFHTYQVSSSRKMDPESIRNREISCSSAAALLGTWWMKQYPQLIPVYLIEDVARTGHPKGSAHVHVALPVSNHITPEEAEKAFFDSGRTDPNIRLIDWTEYSKMKESNPNKSYPVHTIEGLLPYLRNRVAVLGLPKKYSTKSALVHRRNA